MGMQKSRIINKYFNKDFEFRVQVYNLLAFTGMISGFFVAILCVAIKDSIPTVATNFMIAVISFAMLKIAEKKKCYDLCIWIAIFPVFFVAFPMQFFNCGGFKSGATCIFVVGIVFTAFLLDSRKKLAIIAIQFALYVSCCFAAYYFPGMVAVLPADFSYFLNGTMNFAIAGLMLLIAVMFRANLMITKQNQIQELNRELETRNETLAQFDQMKNDFLATVAHEINTPLAIIAGSSGDTIDLLRETPPNAGEIMENQLQIDKKVKLINSIMLDLMDIAAIEAGRLTLHRQEVDLSGLLEDICKTRRSHSEANNNRIVYEPSGAATPQICIDPSRIEQVVTNLLSNALSHTKNGTVRLSLAQKNGNQVVSVADNGEGMDAQVARVALERYVSTKADYWRHGIGLYVCNRIVTAHGGNIWIESEKGVGTTVRFSLKECENERDESELDGFEG